VLACHTRSRDLRQTEFGVMLFYSTNWAIRAERLAVRAGLDVNLIPTPRHLSSDCGTALRFHWADQEVLIGLLKEHEVGFAQVAQL
jgi:hypothetical protein